MPAALRRSATCEARRHQPQLAFQRLALHASLPSPAIDELRSYIPAARDAVVVGVRCIDGCRHKGGVVKVEIRSRGFSITAAIRSHTERRLAFALDRFSRRVKTVLVWVGDMNGPKGGVDKCCRIAVELLRGRVVLEERGSDLYVAIDRAADRAAEKVGREVRRANRPLSPRWKMAG